MASGIVESQGSSDSSQEQQGAKGAITRSRLVQRLLAASANLPQFVNDLLTTQAVTVAGTEAAAFLIERSQETFSLRPISHIRPDESSPETRAQAIAAFQDIVRPCVEQQKDGAVEIGTAGDSTDPQFCLVTLLRSEGEVIGASAVITRCRNTERAKQRLMSMQLVAGYFELYSLRRTSEQARVVAQSHQHVLQLATSVATAEGFDSAAMNLCNELATRAGAARVSIGWLKGKNIKVRALSHTEKFDKKQELIVQLEKVMEECADQEEVVQYDPDGHTSSQNVTRAAAELSRAQGNCVVLSLPLRRQSEICGVATLEFPAHKQLGPQVSTGLAVAVDLLAPQLYDRYQNDRYLITKAGISTREMTKLAIGPKHMVAKLVITLLLSLTLFVCFYKPMYKVSALFEFTPIERRTVTAPFDGEIKEVLVKPGDVVEAGAALLSLDTRDLENELAPAMAEVSRWMKEADNFRKKGEIAEEEIALARRDEAEAKVKYLQGQIDARTVKASIAGEVLRTNDLERKIGSRVQIGSPLIDLGQRGKLRAELAVNERDIQDLKLGVEKQGGTGLLATTTDPRKTYPFTIDRIVPEGMAKEGENVFKVYATLDEVSERWLPGQRGEARVNVEERPLIWIWTHRLVDFLRLKFWM